MDNRQVAEARRRHDLIERVVSSQGIKFPCQSLHCGLCGVRAGGFERIPDSEKLEPRY